MSMATRAAKWVMPSRMRSGQETLGQYVITSSCGRSTLESHAGQRAGILNAFSFPVRFSRTGPRIWGMTSPARVTSTQSPTRMSLAVIEFGETLLEFRHGGVGSGEIRDELMIRLDGKAPGAQLLQQLALRLAEQAMARRFDMETEHAEATSAGDLGIELTQCTGRSVAGVGEERFIGFGALAIDALELTLREID